MTAPAIFKQSDVTRALKGAMAANVAIGKIKIAPDGTITIIPESSAANDDDGETGWEDA